jgi:hypothetical protein
VKGFKNGDCDTTETQRAALSGLGFKAFAPSAMRKTAAASASASAHAERKAGEVEGFAVEEIGMRETVGARPIEAILAEVNEKERENERENETEMEREIERAKEREREMDRACNKSALSCNPELVS